MKRATLLSVVGSVVAVCTWALPVRSAESKALPKDDEAVQKVIAAFTAAVNMHDARAFWMVFHEDADFTNIWGMRARGRLAI
jgi:hypothetical protein